MSPDINRPFWPFPRHSSRGLMSEARLCWPGFGAGFVRVPMGKPPNRHVPRQKTAATQPFLSGARHHPKNKIRPLRGRQRLGVVNGFVQRLWPVLCKATKLISSRPRAFWFPSCPPPSCCCPPPAPAPHASAPWPCPCSYCCCPCPCPCPHSRRCPSWCAACSSVTWAARSLAPP